MIVPIPFTKALFLYGDPIVVPRDGDPEAFRLQLETTLNALSDQSERDFDDLWRSGE